MPAPYAITAKSRVLSRNGNDLFVGTAHCAVPIENGTLITK